MTASSHRKQTTNLLVADDMKLLRARYVDFLKKSLSNLKADKGSVKIRLSNGMVTWEKETEYAAGDKESSKLYRVNTLVYGQVEGGRTVTLYGEWKLNPEFADRPTCGLCHEKVTSVRDDNLLDDDKTPVKVCTKCHSDLSYMRKMMLTMPSESRT